MMTHAAAGAKSHASTSEPMRHAVHDQQQRNKSGGSRFMNWFEQDKRTCNDILDTQFVAAFTNVSVAIEGLQAAAKTLEEQVRRANASEADQRSHPRVNGDQEVQRRGQRAKQTAEACSSEHESSLAATVANLEDQLTNLISHLQSQEATLLEADVFHLYLRYFLPTGTYRRKLWDKALSKLIAIECDLREERCTPAEFVTALAGISKTYDDALGFSCSDCARLWLQRRRFAGPQLTAMEQRLVVARAGQQHAQRASGGDASPIASMIVELKRYAQEIGFVDD